LHGSSYCIMDVYVENQSNTKNDTIHIIAHISM
jgi:hypothetical protein